MTRHSVGTVLDALALGSASALHSVDFRKALAEMVQALMPRVLAAARELGLNAEWCDRGEMMNTLIVGLCAREGRVARSARASHDPMAYLAECLLSWMREQWGSRSASLSNAHEWLIEGAETQSNEQRYTEIREVIDHTHNLIAPHTPARLQPLLPALLTWLAHNPPQRRSYEAADREAARRNFGSFSAGQVRAVASISWGVRPRQHETSFMVAILLNPEFRPSDSLAHTRALMHFARTMRAEELRWSVRQQLAA